MANIGDFLLVEQAVLHWLGPDGNDANVPVAHHPRKVVINQLVQTGKPFSVCKIIRPDANWGSGFHLGNGWVVTNSHVLNSRACVDGATFEFTTPDGEVRTFGAHPRFAFRYRINEQDIFGNIVPDLAMVKLGVQSEYAGVHQPAPWETEERTLHSTIPSLVRPFDIQEDWVEGDSGAELQVTHTFTRPNVGERANTVHFGNRFVHNDPCQSKQYAFTDNAIQQVRQLNNSPVVIFQHRGVTQPGSSGSPVFNDDGVPIGVTYAGNLGDIHQSFALCWETEMQKIQQLGLVINTDAETIRAYLNHAPHVAEKTRLRLQQLAQDEHVDIFV